MLNSMSGNAAHQRRSSRSNSTSSSVVTVKKAASLSSRSGSRTPHLKPRPISPEPFGSHLSSALPTQSGRTNRTSRSRPGSVNENRASSNNLNINRWSHSTTSSTSGIDTEPIVQRNNDSSRRLSVDPVSTNTSQPVSKSQGTLSLEPRAASKQSPKKTIRSNKPPSNELPPRPAQYHVSQNHSYYGSKATTPSSGSATPVTADLLSTPLTGPVDYFGDKWDETSFNTIGPGTQSSGPVSVFHAVSSPSRRHDLRLSNNQSFSSQSNRYVSPVAGRFNGHTRQRGQVTRGSTDTTTGSSMSSIRSDQSRARGHRSPTQKTMLSKALTKANTAVLLDNAGNFEGAAEAYTKACDLLQQVMLRSSDVDDRKKLSAIHSTYAARISELQELEEPMTYLGEKELPQMPPSDDARDAYYEDLPVMTSDHSRMVNGISIPPRLESMLPSSIHSTSGRHMAGKHNGQAQPSLIKAQRSIPPIQTGLVVPVHSEFLPSPLSPRRPLSPRTVQSIETESDHTPTVESSLEPGHIRESSDESTSWLDTIDESASSTSTSRMSSLDYRPSVSDNLVDEIEAELDAALNAAVHAAYNDDEDPPPAGFKEMEVLESSPTLAANIAEHSPSVGLADDQTPIANTINDKQHSHQDLSFEYLDDDAEEEERLLEEMTRGYMFDDFQFDPRSKSALPRQSDSSGFSGRTWGSSVASTNLTTGSTLSTLTEANEMNNKAKPPPLHPPPEAALPTPPIPVADGGLHSSPSMPPPARTESRPTSLEKSAVLGVRDRRMSGQNAKVLKIETNSRASVSSQSSKIQPILVPLPSLQIPAAVEATKPLAVTHNFTGSTSASTLVTAPLTPMTSIHSGDSFASESPATSAPTNSGSLGSVDEAGLMPASPAHLAGKMMPPPSLIRNNTSSSSLKTRDVSAAKAGESTESPLTPGMASFLLEGREKTMPTMQTPTGPTFNTAHQSVGGFHLFDDHLGTPSTPLTPRVLRTPAALSDGTPQTLEPCPDSFLLRPFWLMRCLHQTIVHPRGGYITTKLFVPRDIWRVRNVKLKAVDEKIGQCDMLTAALLKLAKVDNLDADAVLEELQLFETVMEQVRVALQKKLGGDVGLSGSSSLFKGSPSTEGPPDMSDSKNLTSTSSATKSFASSWRKLRSKSSGAGISASYSGLSGKESSLASGLSMATLPMTSSSNSASSRQLPRRLVSAATDLANMGPNAHYMGSLAKLFDAVQVIDQIARQVEDPGLKCSSKTHVGLELSVRNAAEFFAFYVLRFVLGDVGVLMDKFIKRGSEWVLL